MWSIRSLETILRLLTLQVHGGLEFVQGRIGWGVAGSTGGDADCTKSYVRYRNIRNKDL